MTSSGGRSDVVRGVLRWLTRHPSKRPALNWIVWVVAVLALIGAVTPKNSGGTDSKAASASVSASAPASTTSAPASTSAAAETSSEAASTASVASTTEAPSTTAAPVSASPTPTIAPVTKAALTYPLATKDYLKATHRMKMRYADGSIFSDADLIKTGKIACQALAIDGVPFESRKSVLAN